MVGWEVEGTTELGLGIQNWYEKNPKKPKKTEIVR